jgi:hypothetical protein
VAAPSRGDRSASGVVPLRLSSMRRARGAHSTMSPRQGSAAGARLVHLSTRDCEARRRVLESSRNADRPDRDEPRSETRG